MSQQKFGMVAEVAQITKKCLKKLALLKHYLHKECNFEGFEHKQSSLAHSMIVM